MDESLRTVNLGYAVASEEQRNRVLRNTYWLLALSMVPTVLGAWNRRQLRIHEHDGRGA